MNRFALFHNMFAMLHMSLYLLILMIYASKCKIIYITQKMILSALACHCSLDTGQESYDLGDLPVLVRHNIEKRLMKLKVGKWPASKL